MDPIKPGYFSGGGHLTGTGPDDLLTIINEMREAIRHVVIGTIAVGDIGGLPVGDLEVTGNLVSAHKINESGSLPDSTITVVWPDTGKVPVVTVIIENEVVGPRVQQRIVQEVSGVSATGMMIRIDEGPAAVQNLRLHIVAIC